MPRTPIDQTYLVKNVLCYDKYSRGWFKVSIRLAEDRRGLYLHSYKFEDMYWKDVLEKAYYVSELSEYHSLSNRYTYSVSDPYYTFYF